MSQQCVRALNSDFRSFSVWSTFVTGMGDL